MNGVDRALRLLACCCLVACASPPTASPDAGAAEDASASTEASATLFSPCTSDSECPLGGRCQTRVPGGLCTTACTSDEECGETGICAAGIESCAPRCASGELSCAGFGACVIPQSGPTWCTSLCYADDRRPEGWTPCAEGQVCNEWRGRCVDPSEIPTTGAPNGGPCATHDDCLSRFCLTEVDASGTPTGYIDGICVGVGAMAADSEFVPGAPLPRSSCVAGSVVLRGAGLEGDLTLCYPECAEDADCREGYMCFRGQAFEYATGGCLPIICSIPSMRCPAGYACQVIDGLSRCAAMTDT